MIWGPSGPFFVVFRDSVHIQGGELSHNVRNSPAMNTWTTFTAMVGDTEILLDLLDADGETAGWIVRRSCNVFQAFKKPAVQDGNVVNLRTDGDMVGIFPDQEDARDAILEALGITEPQFVHAA